MTTIQEKEILRELAKQVMEIAADDVNTERYARAKGINSLRPARPVVWIEEIPWHEMDVDGGLVLKCESKEGRAMENYFRRILYRWKYIQADMVVENAFYIEKSYDDTGIGLAVKEEALATSAESDIFSHHYEDQLDTEEKVEALKKPVITAWPDLDAKNLEWANDILNGVMPVRLRGHQMFYCPWDRISTYRGLTNCLMDMAADPDLTHKTILKFTEIFVSRYEQMEELGLLDFNISSLHCTPPYADELPAKDWDGGRVRFKDMWFRGMAQPFASASPEMQNEFDLQYMKPFMERCGLSYYGCCEPLDGLIPYLRKISNMRKIVVSPWADAVSSAEQIGGDFVFSWKPNPANAAVFNAEKVEKEIRETVEVCIANNCPYEITLKDISTVGGNPRNLWNWVKVTNRVLDKYYS